MKDLELHNRLIEPLRLGRIYYGISQLEMAKKLGKKTGTFISLIENGQRGINVTTYVLWREALGMSLNFLHDSQLEFEEERSPFPLPTKR